MSHDQAGVTSLTLILGSWEVCPRASLHLCLCRLYL